MRSSSPSLSPTPSGLRQTKDDRYGGAGLLSKGQEDDTPDVCRRREVVDLPQSIASWSDRVIRGPRADGFPGKGEWVMRCDKKEMMKTKGMGGGGEGTSSCASSFDTHVHDASCSCEEQRRVKWQSGEVEPPRCEERQNEDASGSESIRGRWGVEGELGWLTA
jgi:hypothetical protein